MFIKTKAGTQVYIGKHAGTLSARFGYSAGGRTREMWLGPWCFCVTLAARSQLPCLGWIFCPISRPRSGPHALT